MKKIVVLIQNMAVIVLKIMILMATLVKRENLMQRQILIYVKNAMLRQILFLMDIVALADNITI